jgi:hydrogenase maturation factor
MRVLIIDFQGTLTTVPNPLDFVASLQGQGDYVVLHSGSSLMDIEERAHGLLNAVDDFVEKPTNPRFVLTSLTGVTEVIVCDDEKFLGEALVRFGKRESKAPWRFLHADQIAQLLEPR